MRAETLVHLPEYRSNATESLKGLGYGWEKEPSGARDSRQHVFEFWGQKKPAVGYVLGVDDLTVDCIRDAESLRFSADLPNGMYDLAIWVGDLACP